jgi:hypothetical protein
MIVITLFDGKSDIIASASVPDYSNAAGAVFVGTIHGNGIAWSEGSTPVRVTLSIGTKFDPEGRPTAGIPIEQWVRSNGRGRARSVRVEITDAIGDESIGPGSSAPGGKSDRRRGGDGEIGEAPGTPGNRSPSGTNGSDKQDVALDDAADGDQSRDQHRAPYPGEEKSGRRGGADKGPADGNVGGHKQGNRRGKRDGNKEKVGYFWDPERAGRGTDDVPHENGTDDGMSGGTGKKGDHGTPQGGGIIPLISVPRAVAAAATVGLILNDVLNLTDKLIEKSLKLGKIGAKATAKLREAVKAEFDAFVDRELKSFEKQLQQDAQFTAKTAKEQAEFITQAKQEISTLAHDKIVAELDRRIATAEGYAKKAKENPGAYSQDVIDDQLAEADAIRRVKDALPEKQSAALAGKEFKNVEILDKSGKPLGEFDRIRGDVLIEEKSAKGLNTIPPGKSAPMQTPEQWAERQIYKKTKTRIQNLNVATGTRDATQKNVMVPTLDEIKQLRKLEFHIDAGGDALRLAVADEIAKLRKEFPDWTFDAKFGSN